MPFGSRDGHIEEPPFFFQFILGEKGIGRWKPAVDHPDDKHALPLQPLCGMDRRKHKTFIITIKRFHVHGTPIRRLQREISKKLVNTLIALGNRMEVIEISRALRVIVVLFLENRKVVLIDMIDLFGRLSIIRSSQALQRIRQVLEPLPGTAAHPAQHIEWSFGFHNRGEQVLSLLRPHPFYQQQHAMPTDRIKRVGDDPHMCQ